MDVLFSQTLYFLNILSTKRRILKTSGFLLRVVQLGGTSKSSRKEKIKTMSENRLVLELVLAFSLSKLRFKIPFYPYLP